MSCAKGFASIASKPFCCSQANMSDTCKARRGVTFVDLNGVPAMDVAFNPNGSVWAIKGVTSPDGRVFGKMVYAERIEQNLFKNVPGNYELHLFASTKEYFDI